MHNITISWLSTTPWSMVNIGEYEYLILGISLDMEGTLANLMAFISEIESNQVEQFHVQYLDITNNNEEISSSGPVSVSLDLAVYAHPPITN